jgi:hypothetical protein
MAEQLYLRMNTEPNHASFIIFVLPLFCINFINLLMHPYDYFDIYIISTNTKHNHITFLQVQLKLPV